MKRFIFDSCFWFALFDEKDQYHNLATKMAKDFDSPAIKILIPFPSMYETLNTEFVNDKRQLNRLHEILANHDKVQFIFDDKYKENAYANTLSQKKSSKISLVDYIILEMLSDKNLSIDGVVTFNTRDFSEPCRSLSKELVCYAQASGLRR